ncbi:MAG TPA: FeoB-associated Cys-rich membrane protein [Opitutales bacterium]|nr:FeoB-associated Cys-rich membrane protein [Opitutales bacterium]
MIETIIVGVIVLSAAAYLGRSLIRALSGKTDGCHCGGACKSCGSACASLVRKHHAR